MAFSSQVDVRFYGFNYTGGNGSNVRWGFGWNENGGGLYPNGNEGSNDVSGGIGLNRVAWSAGDSYGCCEGYLGLRTQRKVELYVR